MKKRARRGEWRQNMTAWNQKAALLTAALLLTATLGGCAPGGVPVPTAAPPTPTAAASTPKAAAPGPTNAASPTADAAALATAVPAPSDRLPAPTPSQAGETQIEENGKAAVDASHAADGYLLARRGESEKRMKLRLSKDSEYTYDLTSGEWTAFPFSEGDGTYAVAVFEQVEDTTYAPVLTMSVDVKLTNQLAPFLCPNQQVDYENAPLTLAKAAELTAECETGREKTEKIYAFVSTTLRYDDEQAESVQSGYIPALDKVLEGEKGICLDFAALMTAMLRSQDMPCKLVVGDAGKLYHAWTEVWDEENSAWVRYDPTFAASGKDMSGVEYTPKFYY